MAVTATQQMFSMNQYTMGSRVDIITQPLYTRRRKVSKMDVKPIRHRASTPRSKTGCITCKMRRLKCGEEKPGCARCAKSGWVCDGYAAVSSSTSSSSRPRPSASPDPSHGVLASLSLTEQERQYFQIYADLETPSLAPVDKDPSVSGRAIQIWKQTILQEAETNACVRHLIVAHGALAQSFGATSPWGQYRQANAQPNAHHQFALLQYDLGLKALRASMDSHPPSEGLRSTFISCLTLMHFDSFIGNIGFVARNVAFAKSCLLASRTMASSQLSLDGRLRNHIEEPLEKMFIFSEKQILSEMRVDLNYDMVNEFSFKPSQAPIPHTFFNLEEALVSQYSLIWDCTRLLVQIMRYDQVTQEQIPIDVVQTRDYMVGQIHAWNTAFQAVLQTLNSHVDTSQHPLVRAENAVFSITVLLIQLMTTLHAPVTVFDDMKASFEYLLDVSTDVVQFEAATSPFNTEGMESYVLETRIVPALSLVATKCHKLTLRHQAISLLLGQWRREGVWDSLLCGRVAEWMMSIEEGAVSTPGSQGGKSYVPADRRTWGETVERDLQNRRAVVKCKQKIPFEEGGGWVERVTEVFW